MDTFQIIVLALVQGLTEFLPISSSAHLILVPKLFGWQDQGLAIDVAAHFGTLLAILWYFRHDLHPLFADWSRSIRLRKITGDSILAWGVIIGTLPAAFTGYFLDDYSEQLRNPLIIASSTLIFGLLLWYADASSQNQLRRMQKLKSEEKADAQAPAIPRAKQRTIQQRNTLQKSEHQLNLKMILFIGFAQAIALIPGTSRSGITITAGLLMGMSRQAAARFSFLLSIPIILAASLLETMDLSASPVHINWTDIFLVTSLAGISAYFCIYYFLRLLDSVGMMPFIIYRFFLGAVLLWVFF